MPQGVIALINADQETRTRPFTSPQFISTLPFPQELYEIAKLMKLAFSSVCPAGKFHTTDERARDHWTQVLKIVASC